MPMTPAGSLSRLEDRRHPSAGWLVVRTPQRRRRRSTFKHISWRTLCCTMTSCVTLRLAFILVLLKAWNAAETAAGLFRVADEPRQGRQPGLPSLLTH